MNEIEQFKQNKIKKISQYHNLKLNERSRQYILEKNSISKKLLSQKQKVDLINSITNKYKTDVNNLNLYIKQQISYINELKIDDSTIKNKKALLFGLNYENTYNELNGCINDANNISNFIQNFGFKKDNINIYTDDTEIKPTASNIITLITDFLKNALDNDLLFLYYSGHGSYTYDSGGDELDKKDEVIVSLDLFGIKDDDLKNIIKNYLKKNVTLFCLFDCCNSGSILDMKYQYLESLNYNLNNNTISDTNDIETNGNVVLISGCRDEQYSYETNQINTQTNNTQIQGLMTTNFINIVNSDPLITWKNLLIKLRDNIKKINNEQLPQLSSGKLININSKVYL